jgi:hypothetical protein
MFELGIGIPSFRYGSLLFPSPSVHKDHFALRRLGIPVCYVVRSHGPRGQPFLLLPTCTFYELLLLRAISVPRSIYLYIYIYYHWCRNGGLIPLENMLGSPFSGDVMGQKYAICHKDMVHFGLEICNFGTNIWWSFPGPMAFKLATREVEKNSS